jgi:phosphate transport system substrate-binding protein
MKNILIITACFATFWLSSCDTSPGTKIADTQTSGSISICVDETYKPVMEQQIKVFEGRYPDAKINVEYLPEQECFKRFFEDTTRVIFVSRELSAEENEFAKSEKIVAKSMSLARDAIAFVVSNNVKRNQFTVAQIKDLLSGKGSDKDLQLVFDNKASSTVRYLIDSLIPGQELSKNVFAADGSEAVVDYVASNPNAIGVVGVPWVADVNDATTIEFMNKVQVVGILPPGGDKYLRPYQAYIGLNTYPFTRNLYFISKETWVGLGTGFVNFCSHDGQLIFKQSKLFPLRVNVLLKETAIKNN